MTTTPGFATSEALRTLLRRLHDGGGDAWRNDREAADLMAFTMRKYGALARKHGLEPADAAVAAFEVMRTRAARNAFDPWAVVTRAVQLTLMYEAKANGLLCSPGRARRPESEHHHDAERFTERATPVYDYHPAFRVEAEQDEHSGSGDQRDEPTNAFVAVDRAVEVFTVLGWPADTARTGIEYICNRLMRAGSRPAAFEALRRDPHAQALLDLDQRGWLAMLRAVLGNQHRDRVRTCAGRGLLLLLLSGHQVEDVLAMPDLSNSITRGARLLVAGTAHA